MFNLVVVSNKNDLQFLEGANFQVVDVHEYLCKSYAEMPRARVFNLCRDYSYCKKGYYVSLIAEARGHRPVPNVSSLMDFASTVLQRVFDIRFSELIQKQLKSLKSSTFELSIYFGRNTTAKYGPIAKYLFGLFPAPLLRASFVRKGKTWSLKQVNTISLKDVPKEHREFLISAMNDYFAGDYEKYSLKRRPLKYDLAILINPHETLPPSDAKALKKFVQAGEHLRIRSEFITSKDISLLPRFDGLFLRETTSVNDHTYKFAKQAQNEGLVVIDDPLSIIRCCNKVYLNDLLIRNKLPLPKTQILVKSRELAPVDLRFPIVVKKPDSSFSAGVEKIESQDELRPLLDEFFRASDLIILQEFLRSDYDWRVGLIDGEPLYVCKYFMAKNHWQIINYKGSKEEDEGEVETLSISEAPPQLLKLAKRACHPIGNSLYGVDIKEVNGSFFVIEVNDNPNIFRGDEDKISGDSLYLRIMASFLRRMESR